MLYFESFEEEKTLGDQCAQQPEENTSFYNSPMY